MHIKDEIWADVASLCDQAGASFVIGRPALAAALVNRAANILLAAASASVETPANDVDDDIEAELLDVAMDLCATAVTAILRGDLAQAENLIEQASELLSHRAERLAARSAHLTPGELA